MVVASDTYAARLDIDYPERLDRLTSFLRLIWIIPIAIILSVLSAWVHLFEGRDLALIFGRIS